MIANSLRFVCAWFGQNFTTQAPCALYVERGATPALHLKGGGRLGGGGTKGRRLQGRLEGGFKGGFKGALKGA